MKTTLLAVAAALAATAVPTLVHAEDAPSTSFNVGVVTDYRYRGISQSRLKPALQGGVDYSHPSGFYLGAWGSTIKWIKDAGTIATADAGNTQVEIDLYGGYKGQVTKEISYDVGGLYYLYPGNKIKDLGGENANTLELYGALSMGTATVKYSHAVTHTFGNPDSKNSFYVEGSMGFDIGAGLTLTPHIGYQKIHGPLETVASYTDYSLSLSKDFNGLVVSATAIGTDADKTWYVSPAGKFLGRSSLVLGVKYNF